MRLPQFEYFAPVSLEDALKLKDQMRTSAWILAGGTDLVVNLKHRLLAPAALISIRNIRNLTGIDLTPDTLVIRAGTALAQVASHPAVKEHFPILVKAINSIGAMAIQHFRGTIGGNLCLTPRCLFYNQSLFWRKGKGSCHRTGAKDCLALKGSESCQSICSGDTVPVLLALSASVRLVGLGGSRVVPLTEFFSGLGESPYHILPEEILTEIRIPLPWAPISWSYQRLGMRSAVDFPLVNAAAVAVLDKGKVEHLRLVISAVGPAPVILREAEKEIKGAQPEPRMADRAAEIALRAAGGVVVENAIQSRDYRVKMAGVMARRAVKEALRL